MIRKLALNFIEKHITTLAPSLFFWPFSCLNTWKASSLILYFIRWVVGAFIEACSFPLQNSAPSIQKATLEIMISSKQNFFNIKEISTIFPWKMTWELSWLFSKATKFVVEKNNCLKIFCGKTGNSVLK